jgi:hypothetical protein
MSLWYYMTTIAVCQAGNTDAKNLQQMGKSILGVAQASAARHPISARPSQGRQHRGSPKVPFRRLSLGQSVTLKALSAEDWQKPRSIFATQSPRLHREIENQSTRHPRGFAGGDQWLELPFADRADQIVSGRRFIQGSCKEHVAGLVYSDTH